MLAQVCIIYAELAALFVGGAAVVFQLLGPGAGALNRDEYCS